MTKLEKTEMIREIYNEQLLCINKGLNVLKLPEPKRPSTNKKRSFRIVAYALRARQLEAQKQMIIAIPTID